METKRQLFECMVRNDGFLGENMVEAWLKRYDDAKPDAPVNGGMTEALEWAKEQGRKEAEEQYKTRIEKLNAANESLTDELNAADNDIENERQLRLLAEEHIKKLEPRLNEANKQNQVQQVVIDKLEKSHKLVTDERDARQYELTKYKTLLNEAEKNWKRDRQKLELQINNYDTIISENEQLRVNHQGELAKYIRENAQLRKDLDDTKDARIEAEREANDLREWRRGLVRPGTVKPKRWPVCIEAKNGNGEETFGLIFDKQPSQRWFDPREIFEAADRDKEDTAT